jgi:HlyD family secretion protein
VNIPKKKILVPVAVVVVAAAIVLANVLTSYEDKVDVEVTDIKRGMVIEKVSGPGIVYAESAVKISSSVMGRITRLAVSEGDRVQAGNLLLEIDDSKYRARVEQAEALLRAARARLDLAEARLVEAREEFQRSRKLFEANLVSTRELDAARTGFDVARAEREAAREAVSEAGASLEAARDDLEKTVIVSPLSGTVTSLDVEEGEIVVTGTMNNPGTVMMTVSNLDTMEVRAEIDETDIARVRPEQEVEISVDAFPDTLLKGRVSVVGSSASAPGGLMSRADERSTFEVRIRILDPLPGLRPGMTTTVDVITAVREEVLIAPLRALVLRERGEGDERNEVEGIFVVDDDRARFTPVVAGVSDDTDVELLGDFTEGSQVITGPFRELRDLEDSTLVKIVEEIE